MKKRNANKTKAATNNRSPWDQFGAEPEPKPAYCPFVLEDGVYGKSPFRLLLRGFYGGKYQANVGMGLFTLHKDAIGQPDNFIGYFNEADKMILREKHKALPPEQAATELVGLALDAITWVQILYKKKPELCRVIARKFAEWPVSADLTAKDWKRDAQQMIDFLGLGSSITGYIKSARTSDENPVRLYAAVIQHTLIKTRWDYKTPGQYRVREGCPKWAAKTLSLPKFTKANVGDWMKVGREMLLEQRPDFISDPAWGDRKFKWTRRAENKSKSGKASLRAIQNEAFTDIGKEMKDLAPAEDLFRGDW